MTKKEHIVSSLLILLGSGIGLIYSLIRYAQPKNIAALALDPYAMPAVVFGGMFFLGAVRLIAGLRMPADTEKGTLLKIPVKSLLTAAFIGLYVFALKPVGFVLSSFLYLWAQMYILQDGKKDWKIMALISVVCSLGIYLLFVKVFAVMLPRGILTFL